MRVMLILQSLIGGVLWSQIVKGRETDLKNRRDLSDQAGVSGFKYLGRTVFNSMLRVK